LHRPVLPMEARRWNNHQKVALMRKKRDEMVSAMEYTYRVLSYRQHSRLEMERLLERENFSPQVAGQVLKKLEDYGLVDDLVFAKHWVERRKNRRGCFGLRAELHDKGVDPAIIEKVLDGMDPADEFNAAMRLAEKKMKRSGKRFNLKSLAGFLRQRGFSFEIIDKICSQIFDEDS